MTNQIDIRNEKVMMNAFTGWREVVSVNGSCIVDSQGRSWMVSGQQAQQVQSHMNMRDAMREAEANVSRAW